MYVDIKGKVYKTVGGTTSPYTNLSRSELSLYFLKSDGTIDSIPNTNSLTGGFTVSGNTFATKYYNETGWADETVFVAVLTVGSSEVARESIQINKYGEQGSTGKGIQNVVTSYARSSVATTTNDTTAPAIDGSWTTAQPTLTDTYPYMWKKEVITWTNGTTTTRYTMIGQRGGPGSQGSRGPALRGPQAWSDLETNYQLYKGAEGEPYKDIVLYNGNYYTCIKTHTKTATNYPGSTYDTNNNLWQLSDKVEMIAANVMFAEHGFFGDAIISGQWLISANGTIDTTDYTKGQTFNGELAYDLFNADSPLGADISKYNNTSTTTISSSEATKNKDTVSLQAGKVYKINCVGYTSNASHPVYVRLVKTDNSSVYVTPINLNSASSVERYGYAHIVQTGNYYIQLYHDTGYTGTLTSCKIVEKCFAPKYALNLRSGKVYENDAHVKGNIYRPPFTINNSNYTTYAPKNSNDVYIIDLKKTGLNIQLDFTASGTILIDFPTGDEYLGAEITIVNSSNQDAYVETILWGEGDASFAISRYSGYAAFKYVKYTNAFGNTVARWWVTASIYDPGNC